MNYEKKYKEALERAKKFIEANPLVQNLNTWIKETFPELKESEDEQIRKRIIHALHGDVLDMEETNKAIAWLEKQGDSPIKWNKNTKDCKPKVSHSVLMKTTHGIAEGEWQGEYWHQYRWAGLVRDTDVLSWMELSDLEKQGEKEPTIEMKTPEESLDIDSDTYNKIVDECIYGENKPADKVEPKFKVKYAGSEYNVLEIKDIAGVAFYGIEDEPNHIDYVKAENCEIIDGYAIKENGSPYPTKSAVFFGAKNPTWSKEDEKMVDNILTPLATRYPFDIYQPMYNWLKSLKQRIGG